MQLQHQQPIHQLEGHIHSADVDRDGLAVQQLILGLGLFGLVVGSGGATKLADVVGEGGDQGEQGEDGGELLAVGLVVSVEERGEEHAPHQAVQEDGAGPPVPALAVGQTAAGAKVLG